MKKLIISKFQMAIISYWWSNKYNFCPAFRYQDALYKKLNFAGLVKIRQKS